MGLQMSRYNMDCLILFTKKAKQIKFKYKFYSSFYKESIEEKLSVISVFPFFLKMIEIFITCCEV